MCQLSIVTSPSSPQILLVKHVQPPTFPWLNTHPDSVSWLSAAALSPQDALRLALALGALSVSTLHFAMANHWVVPQAPSGTANGGW